MKKRKILFFLLKTAVSISLLLFIILNINWSEVAANLKTANYFFLSITVLLFFIERSEITYKWHLLIRVRGIMISFARLFVINLIGSFWGLFIPSSLGTDVARGYYLVKDSAEKSVSVSSVFVDRILGIFSIFLLALISVTFAGDLLSKYNIKFYVYLFSAVLLIVFYLFQKEETANFLGKILIKIKYKKFGDMFIKLHKSILEYKKYPRTLLLSFLLTVMAHASRVIIFYFIALSFNISVPLVYFFLFVPILTLVLMVPISIGGLGVGEGAFVAFFSLAGVSLSNCVTIAFTNSILNTLFTLSGGVLYLFYSNGVKETNNLNKLGMKNEIRNEGSEV
jgi:uncharacterized protein (TIRG00374 family)